MAALEENGSIASRISMKLQFNIFGVKRLLSPIAVAQIAPIGRISKAANGQEPTFFFGTINLSETSISRARWDLCGSAG